MQRDKDIIEFTIESISKIEEYVAYKDEELFLRDDILKDACITRLIMIGEYTSKISEDLKNRFSNIEWQLIKAARNYYVHVYRGIDWLRVWETIQRELPPLKQKFIAIKKDLENNL
jgi:uncharacterized protein with HEPN domain